ncbi:MAG: hypothetical protein QY322_03025 [bacterium]|nr:MAG: hypothetical protein QY322_03025 [bacterium]
MVDLPKNIQKALNNIYVTTSPTSIFLYGSRARADFIEGSDYEVGVLYKENKKVSRSDLEKMNGVDNLRIYPFDHDQFINGDIDTPFPNNTYMRSLVTKAITLYGNTVVETLTPPKIRMIDLFEEATFQISRAYTAMLSDREGDIVSAKAGFVKSVLYGTSVLIALKLQKFVVSYDEIVRLSRSLNLSDEYVRLIEHSFDVRNGAELEKQMLYKNMSYISKEVIAPIKTELGLGNKVII